ncbi:MAG: inositol monophosphatase family protein [Bdellovibrionota bacterium]
MPSKAIQLSKKNLSEFTRVAVLASQSAGRISKDYFYKNVKTHRKTDDSPVTIADRNSELEIRRMIKKHFPSHEIFGEEFGREKNRDSEFEWIIDPIDGTLQFIRGLPFWGSVLGLCYQGRPVVGVIHHPILNLSIWGSQGAGAFANGKKVKCRKTTHLDRSLVLYSGLRRNSKVQRKFLMNVLDAADDDRGIGDCYGHSLVIQGVADAMIDLKVSAHDISGIKVCIEEAGGSFFSLSGKKSIHEGTALSCTKALAPKILKYFN